MNGKGRRNKGQVGERELCAFLTKKLPAGALNEPLTRNLEQVRQGGADIILLPPLAIEVKRQETLNLNTWWRQATSQAQDHQIAVLAYRQNFKKWTFCIPEHHIGCGGDSFISLSEPVFLEWVMKHLIIEQD